MIPAVERVLLLKSSDIFSEIPGELLVQVAELAEEVCFEPDEVILKEGDAGNCMYLIVSGHVRVLTLGTQIAELHDKECVGEMSLLDSEPRSATVIANTDVITLRIDQAPFFELLAERAELSRGLIVVMSRRIRGMLMSRAKRRTL